ncbi:hypothetical protein LTR50_005793 [Elasticomyces elasticus]|nr:hypothetical protein LTR50_005793 [Elasticomyces elasticus]
MPSKVLNTGFKPMNTLNSSPRFSSTTPKRRTETYGKQRKPSYWPASLDFETSTGDNVPLHKQTGGFPDQDQPMPKKRRIQQAQKWDIPSDDDLQVTDRVVERVPRVKTKPISSMSVDSQGSKPLDHAMDPFAQHEYRGLDQNLRMSQKPPRRRRDGAHSQSTPRDTGSTRNSAEPNAKTQAGTKAQPYMLEDDSPTETRSGNLMTQAARVEGLDNHLMSRPNGKLPKVKEPAEACHGRLQDLRSPSPSVVIGQVKHVLDNMQKRQGAPKRKETDLDHAGSAKIMPSSLVQYEFPQSVRQRPPELRRQFVRDDTNATEPQQGQPIARHKSTSWNPGEIHNVDLDTSFDELHGGNTGVHAGQQGPHLPLLSRQSRTPDLEMQELRPLGPKRDTTPRQITSHSDLPRTEFMSLKRRQSSPPELPAEAEDSDTEQEIFALRKLRMKDCNLSGRLRLIFDQDTKSFSVQHNGAYLLEPERKVPLSIGISETHRATYSHGQSGKLVLKGSANAFSNGTILFEFVTRENLEAAVIRFGYIANDHLKEVPVDDERMERMFANLLSQREPVLASRAEQTHSRTEEQEVALLKQRVSRGRQLAVADTVLSRPEPRVQRLFEALSEQKAAPASEKARGSRAGRLLSEPSDTTAEVERRDATRATTLRDRSRLFRTAERYKETSPDIDEFPENKRYSRLHRMEKWDQPLVYPPTGFKRTTVDFQDLERLDDGQFLNDNLISFYLRYLEESAPQLKDRVYFFNTFFYTALTTTKKGTRGFNYEAVQRWTKSLDIFDYRYIVIPINVDIHWFVAIVRNLRNVPRTVEEDTEASDDAEVQVFPSSDGVEDYSLDRAVDGHQQPSGLRESMSREDPQALLESQTERLSIGDDESLDDELPAQRIPQPANKFASPHADGVDGLDTNPNNPQTTPDYRAKSDSPGISAPITVAGPTKDTGNARVAKSKKKPPKPLPKLLDDEPVIITLDSFGSAHSAEVRQLKDYLVEEAKAKRGMNFARDQIKGLTAKGLPGQTNFCDCGVFLLGYIQEFVNNPEGFVKKILNRTLDQENDFAGFNPSQMRSHIRELLQQLVKERDAQKREKKKRKEAKRGASEITSESPAKKAKTTMEFSQKVTEQQGYPPNVPQQETYPEPDGSAADPNEEMLDNGHALPASDSSNHPQILDGLMQYLEEDGSSKLADAKEQPKEPPEKSGKFAYIDLDDYDYSDHRDDADGVAESVARGPLSALAKSRARLRESRPREDERPLTRGKA